MSGSRGRKDLSHQSETPRFNNPRWPSHPPPYYNPSSSVSRSWSNESWNWSPSFNMWQNTHPNIQLWPQPQYRQNDHQRGGESFHYEQYHPRFGNAFNPPSARFSERNLAHLHQTPLNDLAGGSHSKPRESFGQQGSSSFNRPLTSVSRTVKQISVSNQSKTGCETVAGSSTSKSRDTHNSLSQTKQSTTSISLGAPKVSEKQSSLPNLSDSFMPPNNDLRNIVKASLKMISATKDQAGLDKITTVQTEVTAPSSPQRLRESRISASTTDATSSLSASPSTSNINRPPIRTAAHRRISQSSTSSNPASTTISDNSGSLLDGIGFIQRTSSETSVPTNQTARIRRVSTNSNGDGVAKDGERMTSISKEQLTLYIRSMDNHQRRQLVEQPRANASQYMLNHLVQENQTARARQLSSLRFRVSSSELEMTSRTETHITLPEDFVEHIKELLANEDSEAAAQTTEVPPCSSTAIKSNPPEPEEDEEIQVLEPPPKTPPLCIDLDLDDLPSSVCVPAKPTISNPSSRNESLSRNTDASTQAVSSQKTTSSCSAAAPSGNSKSTTTELSPKELAKKEKKGKRLTKQQKKIYHQHLEQRRQQEKEKGLKATKLTRLQKRELKRKIMRDTSSTVVVGNSIDTPFEAAVTATIKSPVTQVLTTKATSASAPSASAPTKEPIRTMNEAPIAPVVASTVSGTMSNSRPAVSTSKTPTVRSAVSTVLPPSKTPTNSQTPAVRLIDAEVGAVDKLKQRSIQVVREANRPTVNSTASSAVRQSVTPAVRPPPGSASQRPVVPAVVPAVRPAIRPVVTQGISSAVPPANPPQNPPANPPANPLVIPPANPLVIPSANLLVIPPVIPPANPPANPPLVPPVIPPVISSAVIPVIRSLVAPIAPTAATPVASIVATSVAPPIVPSDVSSIVQSSVPCVAVPALELDVSSVVPSAVSSNEPTSVSPVLSSNVLPALFPIETREISSIGSQVLSSLSEHLAGPVIETSSKLDSQDTNEALNQTTSVQSLKPAGRNRSLSSFSLLFVDIQLEEQQGKERIAQIDQSIEALQLERKALTEKVLALKQRQFDLLRSTLMNKSSKNEAVPSEKKIPKVATEPIKKIDDTDIETQTIISVEQVATPSSPTAVASNQLLSLMQQLEENGVQVAIGDLELELPLHPPENQVRLTVDGVKKRKLDDNEETPPTKKTTSTFHPSSEVTVDMTTNIQPTPSPLPALEPLFHSNNPAPSPTPSLLPTLQPANTSNSLSPPPIQILETFSIPVLESSRCRGNQQTGWNLPDQFSSFPEPQLSSDSLDVKDQLPPLFCISEEDTRADNLITISEEVSDSNVYMKLEATEQQANGGPALNSYSKENVTNNLGTNDQCQLLNSKELPTDLPPPVLENNNESKDDVLKMESDSRSSDPSQNALPMHSERMLVLERHKTLIKSIFVNGPCIFSSSEEGTVHVYDMKTGHLSMRILGHQQPVTWMYAISLNLTSTLLRNITTTAEYLNQLNLITGSEDACIRQFSLETGGLLHEVDCKYPLTSVSGNKTLGKLYIGCKEGSIFTYNPKSKSLQTSRIKVKAEVVCLKATRCLDKRALVVVPKRMDPIIFDLETENILMTLPLNSQGSLVNCITSSLNLIFCCDSRKKVYTFDVQNEKPFYQTYVLPSSAVSLHYDGKRFLILGCCDGVIRALDMSQKSNRLFVLPGPHMKSLTCMKVSGDKIVGGSAKGEVTCRNIPDLEALAATF